MVDIDMTMLAVGLAVVWLGLAAYIARLGAIARRLDRQVGSLRGALTRQQQRRREEE